MEQNFSARLSRREKTRTKVLVSVWRSTVRSAAKLGPLKTRYSVAKQSEMNSSSGVYKSYAALERDFRVVKLAVLQLARRPRKIGFVYDVSLLGLVELLQTGPDMVRPPSDSAELARFLHLLPAVFCAWDQLKQRGLAELAWETLKHVCQGISLQTVKETRTYQMEVRHPLGVIYKARPDLVVESNVYEAFFGIVSQVKGTIPDQLQSHPGTPQQFSRLLGVLLEDSRIALLCTCMRLHKEVGALLDAAEAGRDKGRLANNLDPSFCQQHSILLKPFLEEPAIMHHLEELDEELRKDGLDLTLSASIVARKLILNESPVMDDYLEKSGEVLQRLMEELRETLGRNFEAKLDAWFSDRKFYAKYLSFLQSLSLGLEREQDIYNLDAADQVRVVTRVAEWVMEQVPLKRRQGRNRMLD